VFSIRLTRRNLTPVMHAPLPCSLRTASHLLRQVAACLALAWIPVAAMAAHTFTGAADESFLRFHKVGGWGADATVAWADNVTVPGWHVSLFHNGAHTTPTLVRISGGAQTSPRSFYLFRASSNTSDPYASLGTRPYDANTSPIGEGGVFLGTVFTNATGEPVTHISLGYTAEQWAVRSGSAGTFEVTYATQATSLADSAATWNVLAPLAYRSPQSEFTGSSFALNPRLDPRQEYRQVFPPTTFVLDQPLQPGQSLWLRWFSVNATGIDQSIAIDEIRVTANPTAWFNTDRTVGTDADPRGLGWDYTDQAMLIGSGAGATGAVTVPAGATLPFYDLFLGTGDPTAEGTLTVSGAGAAAVSTRANAFGSAMLVGVDGLGLVTVANGARVERRALSLGLNPGSDGTLTVTGGGSMLVTPSEEVLIDDELVTVLTEWDLQVGLHGRGTLNVRNGAIAEGIRNLRVGPPEAAGSSGSGEVIVEGGGAWVRVGGTLQVGLGSSVRLGPGGELEVNGAIDLGTATGAGSLAVEGGTLHVGESLDLGSPGLVWTAGTLIVRGFLQGVDTVAGGRHIELVGGKVTAAGDTITLAEGASLTGFGRVEANVHVAAGATLQGEGGMLIVLGTISGDGTVIDVSAGPPIATLGMVSAGEFHGALAGTEILRAGGNAVDAAVATAFAMSVADIGNSGLGGGGSMLIWLDGPKRAEFVEFYSRAGSSRSTTGMARNVGIPGNAAGLLEAQERYGRLSREEVMAPAIRLAREGFVVTQALRNSLNSYRTTIRANAPPEIAELLFPGGTVIAAGEWLVQADKATVLELIAAHGRDAFYNGPFTAQLVQQLNADGNPATVEDFANYQPRWYRPLIGGFRQYTVMSAPPPMGGTQVVQPLVILDRVDLNSLGLPTASSIAAAHIIDAIRIGRRDYYNRVFDPQTPVPAAGMVSQGYAADRFPLVAQSPIPASMPGGDPWPFNSEFDPRFLHLEPWGYEPGSAPVVTVGPDSWVDVPELDPQPGDEQTTSLSVVDSDRNAVAITMTLGPSFGAGFCFSGVFFNNAITRFGSVTGNNWAPGRTPRSDTSPTIVLENDQVRLVTGARGSSRIPAAIVHNILYALEYGMPVREAMVAARAFPFYSSATLHIERSYPESIRTELAARGWGLTTYAPENTYFAGAYTIVTQPDGTLQGANDSRREFGGVAGHSDAAIPAFTTWADSHGLGGAFMDIGASPAGDGFTNLAKFAFGLDPTRPASALVQARDAAGSLTLRWNHSRRMGIRHRIERNTTPAAGGWSALTDAVPVIMANPDVEAPAGFDRVEWSIPLTGEHGFYRIVTTIDPGLLP